MKTKTDKPARLHTSERHVRRNASSLTLEARIATIEETMHAVQTQLASLAMRPVRA